MRTISELDLVALIPILAAHVAKKEEELQSIKDRVDDLSDEELDAKHDLHEYLDRLDGVASRMRKQYLDALSERINLPAYESLTVRKL